MLVEGDVRYRCVAFALGFAFAFIGQALTGPAVIGGTTLGPIGGTLERTEVSSIVGATFGGKAEATFVMLLEGRR